MIETRRLKNVAIFFQTILSFVLSRKVINFSYFLVKNYFSDDEFQNMFVSQPKFSTIDFKQVHTG